jgi:hypothetical protein
MQNLILVGGIAYCGKSTLCEKLHAKDKERFPHIEFDRLFDEISHDGEKFFKYLKIVKPMFHNAVKVQCAKDGILDPNQQLQLYSDLAVKLGILQQFGMMIEEVGVAYLADLLADSKESPVTEGLFVDKGGRQRMYQELKSRYTHFKEQDSPELDEVRKLLVFFNLGLRKSLKRLRKGRKKQFESITSNERIIREQYQRQEPPEKDELPNLEVMIITDPTKVDQYVNDIAGRYSPES